VALGGVDLLVKEVKEIVGGGDGGGASTHGRSCGGFF
jgi:hypothetical protein